MSIVLVFCCFWRSNS